MHAELENLELVMDLRCSRGVLSPILAISVSPASLLSWQLPVCACTGLYRQVANGGKRTQRNLVVHGCTQIHQGQEPSTASAHHQR